jgi:hypothetical protein
VDDASGNGNHGSLVGASSTTGKVGNAYRFSDGSCVGVPDSQSLDMIGGTAMTMMAWIQNDGGCASDRGIVLNKENTYEVGIHCAENLAQEAIQLSDGSWFWSGTGPVVTGAWHHLAVTWDGATVRHYLDAVEVFTRDLAGAFEDRATGFGIGCRSVSTDGTTASAGSFFVGVIDEVAIYRRALSAAELSAYHQATR